MNLWLPGASLFSCNTLGRIRYSHSEHYICLILIDFCKYFFFLCYITLHAPNFEYKSLILVLHFMYNVQYTWFMELSISLGELFTYFVENELVIRNCNFVYLWTNYNIQTFFMHKGPSNCFKKYCIFVIICNLCIKIRK